MNYKNIIQLIYEVKNPEKVQNIDELLHKYTGFEQELLHSIYEKYELNEEDIKKIENGINPFSKQETFTKERTIDHALKQKPQKKQTPFPVKTVLALLSIVIVVLVVIFFIDNKERIADNDVNDELQIKENKTEQSEKTFLIINGDGIWVRDEPSTGEVVMKLNKGDKCLVLQKGKKETINGKTDFWYEIEFDGKQGWVFGSQTSLQMVNVCNFESLLNTSWKSKKQYQVSPGYFESEFSLEIINTKSKPKISFKELNERGCSIEGSIIAHEDTDGLTKLTIGLNNDDFSCRVKATDGKILKEIVFEIARTDEKSLKISIFSQVEMDSNYDAYWLYNRKKENSYDFILD
jgi:hypothetical protein